MPVPSSLNFWTQNKDFLYIALYIRGGPPTMPKKEDTFVPTAN